MLVRRLGLAGQRSLFDAQVSDLGEAQVGGNDGTRLEVDDVTGHEVAGRDLVETAFGDHLTTGTAILRSAATIALLGTVFLEEAERS